MACDQKTGGTTHHQIIQTNLEACIKYCAFFDGCELVYLEGTGPSSNCFQKSFIGIVSQDAGFPSTSLQGTCYVSSPILSLSDWKCL